MLMNPLFPGGTGTLTSTHNLLLSGETFTLHPSCYTHHMSCQLLEMHRDSASNPSLSIRSASLGPFWRWLFISEAHYARRLLIMMQHTHINAHMLVWLKDDLVVSSGDTKNNQGSLFWCLSDVKHRKSAPASSCSFMIFFFYNEMSSIKRYLLRLNYKSVVRFVLKLRGR